MAYQTILTTLHGGEQVYAHPQEQCAGERCCIHNPSPHHMRNWVQHWRNDTGIMERICQHGVGHPDPDDLMFRGLKGSLDQREWVGVHGCDGCCDPKKMKSYS